MRDLERDLESKTALLSHESSQLAGVQANLEMETARTHELTAEMKSTQEALEKSLMENYELQGVAVSEGNNISCS